MKPIITKKKISTIEETTVMERQNDEIEMEDLFTVLERQGLSQVAQTRLRTASVDSEKLEWEVSSAWSCASCTDLNKAPQSPHFNDNPAIDFDFDWWVNRSERERRWLCHVKLSFFPVVFFILCRLFYLSFNLIFLFLSPLYFGTIMKFTYCCLFKNILK